MDQPVSPLQDRELWSWQKDSQLGKNTKTMKCLHAIGLVSFKDVWFRTPASGWERNMTGLRFDLVFKYIHCNLHKFTFCVKRNK